MNRAFRIEVPDSILRATPKKIQLASVTLWNLAEEDDRIELCTHPIPGSTVGVVCEGRYPEGHWLGELLELELMRVATFQLCALEDDRRRLRGPEGGPA